MDGQDVSGQKTRELKRTLASQLSPISASSALPTCLDAWVAKCSTDKRERELFVHRLSFFITFLMNASESSSFFAAFVWIA